MPAIKTKATRVSPRNFIAKLTHPVRRADALTLLKLFEKLTGWKAKMWGPTIVGFGTYHYTYDSGHSGSICAAGFSPRKTSLVLYGTSAHFNPALLKKLGKHKTGVSCLYITSLADVDLEVLARLIKEGIADTRKKWPVSA